MYNNINRYKEKIQINFINTCLCVNVCAASPTHTQEVRLANLNITGDCTRCTNISRVKFIYICVKCTYLLALEDF